MKENLSFKNIFQREMKLASYMIICVTIVVISISYALFFQVNENSKNQEVVAGDLVFTYQNGNLITSEKEICFKPMTEEEALLYASDCGYAFSVKNTGTLKANYTLRLKENEQNEVTASKVKVILKKQQGDTLVPVLSQTLDHLTNGVLVTEEMESHQNMMYMVQVYLDESVYEESDVGKKLSYQIEGSGVVHEDAPIKTDTIATTYIERNAKKEELIDDETIDHNLRYVGASPNNYVKFNNELWRVIGVMNNVDDGSGKKETRVKIVRNESIGAYSYDTSPETINSGKGTNEWSTSKMRSLLNQSYFNHLSTNCYVGINNLTAACDFSLNGLRDVDFYIGDTLWNTGGNGNTDHYSISTSQFYALERGKNSGKLCTSGINCNDGMERTFVSIDKIGLIYPSDYGYSTKGDNSHSRALCLNVNLSDWDADENQACRENSWLFHPGQWVFTMMPLAYEDYAFVIATLSAEGAVRNAYSYDANHIYPTLYLKSSVRITSGDGSVENPFVLTV